MRMEHSEGSDDCHFASPFPSYWRHPRLALHSYTSAHPHTRFGWLEGDYNRHGRSCSRAHSRVGVQLCPARPQLLYRLPASAHSEPRPAHPLSSRPNGSSPVWDVQRPIFRPNYLPISHLHLSALCSTFFRGRRAFTTRDIWDT